MFSVIFEVQPKSERWDEYLGIGRMLRPELERIDGFVENVRYRSLTRTGLLLSSSDWRDEKSLVRWRIASRHHEAQARGRDGIFVDYRLRVGQLTRHSALPDGVTLREQRFDETEAGGGTTVTLIDVRANDLPAPTDLEEQAAAIGLPADRAGITGWDLFDAVLSPGDRLLAMTHVDADAAQAFDRRARLAAGARLRRVRVVRDYGMHDRREAPQYFPAAGTVSERHG